MRYLIILSLLCFGNAFAHKSSDSYLILTGGNESTKIQWEIAIRDLENVLVLDENSDGQISWGELKYKKDEIFNYATARLNLNSETADCVLDPEALKINNHSDGAYVVLYYHSPCLLSHSLNITYSLFFEIDAQHRGLMNLKAERYQVSFVFSPDNKKYQYVPGSMSQWQSFSTYIIQGVWHIWIGYDHILFLLSLLLPAVLVTRNKKWYANDSFKTTLVDVIKVVTAFTIAHSLMLSIVMLAGITLPVNLVESLIALSVVIVAFNNLYPVMITHRWFMGFGFGLIHGFGFANVLTELQLGTEALVAGLLGFNVGVELGQLLIVAVFLPIAFALRNGVLYQTVIFRYGSFTIASIGLVWLFERSL